jgi:hypothetical protein
MISIFKRKPIQLMEPSIDLQQAFSRLRARFDAAADAQLGVNVYLSKYPDTESYVAYARTPERRKVEEFCWFNSWFAGGGESEGVLVSGSIEGVDLLVDLSEECGRHLPLDLVPQSPFFKFKSTPTFDFDFRSRWLWFVFACIKSSHSNWRTIRNKGFPKGLLVKQVDRDPFALSSRLIGQKVLTHGKIQKQQANLKPSWDKDTGRLYFDNEIIKTVKNIGQATNVIAVLDTFEIHKWPRSVDDLFINSVVANCLHKTVASLNCNLSRIRFCADGTGHGIRWELL